MFFKATDIKIEMGREGYAVSWTQWWTQRKAFFSLKNSKIIQTDGDRMTKEVEERIIEEFAERKEMRKKSSLTESGFDSTIEFQKSKL